MQIRRILTANSQQLIFISFFENKILCYKKSVLILDTDKHFFSNIFAFNATNKYY